MLKLQQDLRFWRLVEHLIQNEQYRIIRYDEQKLEIWLEPDQYRSQAYIHLRRYDIDWGNWLKQDINEANRAFQHVRKASRKKAVDVFHVYFSSYEPVDDWRYVIQETEQENNRGTRDVYIIEGASAEENLTRFLQELGKTAPDMSDWHEGTEFDLEHLKLKVRNATNQRIKQERKLFSYGKPRYTYILIALNILMFALLELKGSSTDTITLLQFGAKYNSFIINGEWWRLITPMFLHIGLVHLLLNMFALFYLGTAVEKMYGSNRFIIVYLIAGIFGVVASFAFTAQLSAGASGAIYGLFGALLYFGLNHRALFFRTMGSNLLIVLGINLVFGFTVPMVDNSAHLGGLAGGFLASAAVHLPEHKQKLRQLLFIAITAISATTVFAYGLANTDNHVDPLLSSQIAQELIEQGDDAKAKRFLDEALTSHQTIPAETYFLLAYVEIQEGQYELAIQHLKTAITKRPDFPEAYYNLSLVYLELGKTELAFEAIAKAAELAPAETDYVKLYQELQKSLEQ